MTWRQTECITVDEREALIRQEARAQNVDYGDLRIITIHTGELNLTDGRQLKRDARWYVRTPERQAVAR